ncbi:MAG: ATP-dependent DNA helicase RecG [Thermoleophilaceae bacterium]|nr:ATP-dependent DNA helicase RecG [Thermoleophilaceae bacterium]
MARRFASDDELSPEELRDAPLRSLPRPSRLAEALPEIKPAQAQKGLRSLGIATRGDLLEHFPFRHEDRRERKDIIELVPGEDATILAEVRSMKKRPTRRRRLTIIEATVGDETGVTKAVWFNQYSVLSALPAGSVAVLHGKYEGKNRFRVTEFEKVTSPSAADLSSTGLAPVYPATDGIFPKRIRELVHEQRALVGDVVEPLPARLRAREVLPDRAAAVAAMHFPETEHDEEGARAAALEATGELVEPWLETLPFTPTDDQRKAFAEIDADIAGERPMQRLLMGEVGSGKTAVALHSMLRTLEAGRQAVFMAPTETLAEQHLITLDRLLGGHVPVALLTGSTPAARRKEILGKLASGELSLVVGTHALIEPAVEFRALGLVVVDEQHRFGVRQRAALDAKAGDGLVPHGLHMTATPIPRTLYLTAYGDLDATTLKELPAGRKPVETFVVDGARARERAYERIREEIAEGRQCFVVCPLVSESETLQAKAATAEAERLAKSEFRDQRVALIHGQMKTRAKQEAMESFASGEADVLVATSVIEVGIDVPNATVMLIEAAERYGLSQLHQLRGRIGRGEHASVCILFGDPKLPRLKAIAEERDGFRLAEIDLELRGYGEVLGTRQHGLAELAVARLPEDEVLLDRARTHALALIAEDPRLEAADHVLLRDAAAAKFGPDLDPIPA